MKTDALPPATVPYQFEYITLIYFSRLSCKRPIGRPSRVHGARPKDSSPCPRPWVFIRWFDIKVHQLTTLDTTQHRNSVGQAVIDIAHCNLYRNIRLWQDPINQNLKSPASETGPILHKWEQGHINKLLWRILKNSINGIGFDWEKKII